MRTIFLRYKWIVLCVVILLILTPFALMKTGLLPTINLLTKSPAPTPTPIIEKLCIPFPITKGEISCQEAVGITLAKYPGIITQIDLKTETIATPTADIPPKLKTRQEIVWLLTVYLKTPIPPKQITQKDGKITTQGKTAIIIEVAVDRLQPKIIFYRRKI